MQFLLFVFVRQHNYNSLTCLFFFIFTEDVIRRRLLIDGDGTGDDRRLNVLLKTLIKWSNSVDDKPEERLVILFTFGNMKRLFGNEW